jgi:hypothetical protein
VITFELPPRRAGDGQPPWPYELRGVCALVLRQGEARTYGQAHCVARWCLGIYDPAPVACRDCGVTDWERAVHAALDWQAAPASRLRADYRGRVFSVRPDLDYIPLCAPCHKRFDRAMRVSLEALDVRAA